MNIAAHLRGGTQPLRMAVHPITLTDEIRDKRSHSFWTGLVLLVVYFLSAVVSYQYTSRNFSMNKPGSLNVFLVVLQTVFVVLLFVLSNWCVSTLFAGRGTLGQIWALSTYALLPAAAGSFAATLLSYVLSAQEGVFVTWAEAAGIIWTAILLFVTQMTLHEFSFGKTLGVLLLTLAGVIIMIFLLLLFCSLMQEVYGFGSTLYYEIYFRWFVG